MKHNDDDDILHELVNRYDELFPTDVEDISIDRYGRLDITDDEGRTLHLLDRAFNEIRLTSHDVFLSDDGAGVIRTNEISYWGKGERFKAIEVRRGQLLLRTMDGRTQTPPPGRYDKITLIDANGTKRSYLAHQY